MTGTPTLVTVFLLVAVPNAAAQPRVRCATPALMREGFSFRTRPVAPPLFKAAGKQARDTSDRIPNLETSENFALKWGSEGKLAPGEAVAILDIFEAAWRVEVETMEHPQPWGSEAFLLNLYLGDTGPEVPSAGNADGYYYWDDDGWPIIVIAEPLAHEPERLAGTVAAHELYHAIQDRTGRFAEIETSAWFWEATAEWITGEVFEDSGYFGAYLFGYAFSPHLSVEYFEYPLTGAVDEYHHYGAFIWPRYLTEHQADWRLIRDTWLDDAPTGTPLEVLAGQLTARGVEVESAFLDFAAHNTTWDYRHHDLFVHQIAEWTDALPSQDQSLVAITDVWGTGDWLRPPNATLPQRWGANTIQLRPAASGVLVVELQPDTTGSRGGEAKLGAALVRHLVTGARRYENLREDGDSLRGSVTCADDDLGNYLVVIATSPEADPGEVFGYQYRAALQTPDGDPVDGPVRGGCQSVTPSTAALGLMLLLLWRARKSTRA